MKLLLYDIYVFWLRGKYLSNNITIKIIAGLEIGKFITFKPWYVFYTLLVDVELKKLVIKF